MTEHWRILVQHNRRSIPPFLIRRGYGITGSGQARTILRHLLGAVPSGSYISISHSTTEFDAEPAAVALELWNSSGAAPMCLRSREELLLFFEGTELVELGVVSCPRWRPDLADPRGVVDVMHFGRSHAVQATGRRLTPRWKLERR